MAASGEFPKLMAPVAMHLWGQPAQVGKGEMRWGSHGSKAIDLEKGTWFDHEVKEGGGVLDLIEREIGCKGPERIDWLREHGFDIGDRAQPNGKGNGQPMGTSRIVAAYDYVDETGQLLFQVVRLEPKTFRQRRPDPEKPGQSIWNVKGVQLVPYRLPEVVEAIALGHTVFIVEGEKDADGLWMRGVPATCNPMGAGKWVPALNEHFRGARVVILRDNDDAGHQHGALVAAELAPVAEDVKVLDLPGLPAKGDVYDWFAAGGTVEDLYRLAREHGFTPGHERPVSRYGTIAWDDLDSWSVKVNWLVKDILPMRSVAVAYGPTACGKSFLCQELAICVATGRSFFDRRCQSGAAVYVAAEGRAGFKKRLLAYREHHCVPVHGVPFFLIPSAVDLFHDDGDTEPLIEEINAVAKHSGAPLRVVVIDTLAAVAPGFNENASEDMGLVLKHCQQIQEKTDATVIVVHHTPAAGGKPRGHTSLPANVDTLISVTRDDEGGRWFKVSKQKDGAESAQIAFRLQTVRVGDDDDGEPVTSCVVVPGSAQSGAERTSKPNDPSRRLSPKAKIMRDALHAALADFGQKAPPELLLPYGSMVVSWDDVKREFQRRTIDDEQKPAARRQMISRAREELQAARLLSINSELNLAWSTR